MSCLQQVNKYMRPDVPHVTKQIEILMECIRGSQMQSFAEQLNEVEMASVITFTRLAWGNERSGDGEIVIPKDIVEYKETNL